MPRTYSFDHFQAKKPQQSVVGTPDRLGNDEDKQVPLKSELPDTHKAELPQDAGGIHYGMKHAETVKRLQARRAKRAQEEARGKAAAKRPTGKRASAKKATGTADSATAKQTSKASDTASAKKATPASNTASAKKATGTQRTATKKAATAKKAKGTAAKTDTGMAAKQDTGTAAKAPRGGTLSRLVGAVLKGTKGVVRQAALAKEARLGKKGAKAEKPATSGRAKKK